MADRLKNFINRAWKNSSAQSASAVIDQASAEVLAHIPLSFAEEMIAERWPKERSRKF